jgi:hypothetical protein
MSVVDRVRALFRATRTRATRFYERLRGLPRDVRDLYVESSLVRVAELGKSELAVTPRWRRRQRDAGEWLTHRMRAESSWWWLLLLASGVLWLPVPWGFRRFEDPSRAESFLQALWQVQGATLAIALAVVIFVFQAVYASRLSGSLRQFAEETGLFPIFFFGVYAVAIDGVVLLGGGYGAPGGWAATWATIWAAIEGGLLVVLFVSTIRAIEPSALHGRRLTRARREIERETERLILKRIAVNVLGQFCEQNGIEFTAAFGSAPSATAIAVTPPHAGQIKDVRLRRLRKLGRAAQAQDLPQPRLRAYLDVPVGDTSELLWAEPTVIATMRNPWRIFRFRRQRSKRDFRDTIQQLHDEATRVIANPTPGAYGDVLDVYEDMLLALPTTWAKYGRDYAPAIAGEVSPFELGFLDYLGRDLYDEIRAAVLGPNRQIAFDAFRFPVRIAHRAVELRATALSGRMLNLLVAVLDALIRAPDSEVKRDLLESLETSLTTYGEYQIEPLITDREHDAATRDVGRVAMRQLYETLAEICKRILDIDPGKTDLIGVFNSIYEKFFRHWHPEHDEPWPWELEHAQERGADEATLAHLRVAVAENEARVALRDELDDWRLMQRLGLMFWVLRQVRDERDPTWAEAWPVFANYIGDVPKLARILDKAIEADFQDRARWSNWILDTLPKGEVHGIGVDGELIDAFIVRALELVNPDGPPPEIEPMEWTRGRLDDPEASIKRITDQAALAALLPDDRLDERAQVLVEALVTSNRERQEREDQKTIEAPISDAKLADFETELQQTFEAERWLHRALEAAGAVEVVNEEPPEDVHGSQINTWLPKSFFVEEPRVFGSDSAAHQYGGALAGHEREFFVEELRQAPLIQANPDDPLADQLRALIAALTGDGFEPSLVVTPFSWTVMRSLHVELYRGAGGQVEPPEWAAADDGRGVAFGAFDGIPVCRIHRGLDDRIVVVDLSRFASWRDWIPGAEPISFQFDYLNEVEAEQLARDKPQLFEADGDLAARTKAIRMHVRLLAQVRYELELREREAARGLEVPEGLRR